MMSVMYGNDLYLPHRAYAIGWLVMHTAKLTHAGLPTKDFAASHIEVT